MLHRLILRSSFRRYVTWYHNWARLLLMGNFSSQPLKIVSAALSTCFLLCIILILLPPSGVIPLTGLVVLNAREVLLMNIILNCCEFPPWSLFFSCPSFMFRLIIGRVYFKSIWRFAWTISTYLELWSRSLKSLARSSKDELEPVIKQSS